MGETIKSNKTSEGKEFLLHFTTVCVQATVTDRKLVVAEEQEWNFSCVQDERNSSRDMAGSMTFNISSCTAKNHHALKDDCPILLKPFLNKQKNM